MACATAGERNIKKSGAEETIGTRRCQRKEKEQEKKGGPNLTSILNNVTERISSGDAYYIRYSKVNFLATCHDYCVTVY